MYVTCRCLNVAIKTKGSELNKVNIDDVELTADERADDFFKNEVASVKDLDNIVKEQPALVEIRTVGAWVIHRCYNCLMPTHAVHRDYGAALVLINVNIVTSEEEIANLKASPNFSPIFRIVIDHSKIEDLYPLEPLTKYSVSQLSSSLRLGLGGLEQQLQEAIQRQAHLIDARIRELTKQQYEILDKFKERAHSEHAFLSRLICSEQKVLTNSNNLETPPTTPDTNQPIKPTSTNDVVDATLVSPLKRVVISNNSSSKSPQKFHAVNGNGVNHKRPKEMNNYDGDAIFLLDGMDDAPLTNKHLQISDQDSDTDDSGNEGGMHVPRYHRTGHPSLAKSLPVTVPVFHSFNQRSVEDDDIEQISRNPMDPNDIQASIKALARSVHGDTVFGDLPRPRCSTQI